MPDYRGWKSTKLHLALIAMALVCGAYVLTGFPVSEFGQFCMAILGAAGIYSGASTAEKFARPPVDVVPAVDGPESNG